MSDFLALGANGAPPDFPQTARGQFDRLIYHFYAGLEGDPDCVNWFDPDNQLEWILEIACLLPVLFYLWSPRVGTETRRFLRGLGKRVF